MTAVPDQWFKVHPGRDQELLHVVMQDLGETLPSVLLRHCQGRSEVTQLVGALLEFSSASLDACLERGLGLMKRYFAALARRHV